MQTKICFAVVAVLACALVRVNGEPTFTVTDLGTLGGNTTTANSVVGHGMNAAGMIVGSSTTSDNSEHAFLYVGDKMYDLNMLCDLSQSDFKVLTVARTISDSCVIIGDGVTTNGDKHAFKLTPLEVAGGQWNYECCQWVWIQDGGGWWWESNCGCYKWHGPPGKHPPCPPQPPPCWNWPLPCCPGCPPPPPPPPGPPTLRPPTLEPPVGPPTLQPPPLLKPPTLKPPVFRTPAPTPTPTLPPPVRGTPSPTPFNPNATPTPIPPTTFVPGVMQPTPTPQSAIHATATPTRRHRRGTPTPIPPRTFVPGVQPTPTPSRRGSPTPRIQPQKKKKTSNPSPTPYQIR